MNHKPFVTTELNPLPNAVQELIAERDEWKARCEFSFAQRDKLNAQLKTLLYEVDAIPAIKAERDEYAACADKMAAAHKVERDDLSARYETASRLVTSLSDALAKALKERDALKDAARLASRALHRIDAADIRLDTGERLSITKAIAALKAVL